MYMKCIGYFKEIAVLSVTVYLAPAPQDQMRCMENEKCQQQHYKQEISIEILHWNFMENNVDWSFRVDLLVCLASQFGASFTSFYMKKFLHNA